MQQNRTKTLQTTGILRSFDTERSLQFQYWRKSNVFTFNSLVGVVQRGNLFHTPEHAELQSYISA